jgi:SprT protein
MNEESRYYAVEAIKEGLAKATAHYKRAFPFPTLSFDLRGRTAGQAVHRQNGIEKFHIRLNAQLFKENQNEFITRTIPHELAHLISFRVYGSAGLGHKTLWKGVCRVLGMKDVTRCHRYKVTPAWTRRKLERFNFGCGCQVHFLTKIRARRIQLGTRSYRCKACKGKLYRI